MTMEYCSTDVMELTVLMSSGPGDAGSGHEPHDRLHRCASNILALTPYLHSPTSSEGGCEPFSHPNREPARATWLRPPRKNRSHHARAKVLPSRAASKHSSEPDPWTKKWQRVSAGHRHEMHGHRHAAMHEKNLWLCDCWLLVFAARCTFKNGVVCAVRVGASEAVLYGRV